MSNSSKRRTGPTWSRKICQLWATCAQDRQNSLSPMTWRWPSLLRSHANTKSRPGSASTGCSSMSAVSMGFFLALYATTTKRLIALDRSSNTKGSVTKSVGFGPSSLSYPAASGAPVGTRLGQPGPNHGGKPGFCNQPQRVKFVSGAPSKLSGASACRLPLLTLNSSANSRRDGVASTTRCLDMGKPSAELICQNPPRCSTSSAEGCLKPLLVYSLLWQADHSAASHLGLGGSIVEWDHHWDANPSLLQTHAIHSCTFLSSLHEPKLASTPFEMTPDFKSFFRHCSVKFLKW